MLRKKKQQDANVITKLKKRDKHKTLNNTNWIKQSPLAWVVSGLLLLGFISIIWG